jgi:hypothetical protein
MLYSYSTMLYLYKWLTFLTIVSCLIDCFLVFLIKKRNLQVNNLYFRLQRNFGFLPGTVLKALGALCLSYLLLNPPGNAGAVGAIAIVYWLVVFLLLLDVLRALRARG